MSWYATSDNMELFAEAFATWAINPTAYTKYDPKGASQIESLIQKTRKRYTL
ncbi:hypothetical protein HRE53_22815 [Acaryochloris sp. 'Moss Beach']|uniref:hypothetical protein n=1 Tax=Acaryochloris sp. 'Moss Beach' TaxID=2740837 RepID=UPI001F278DDD|nr:hypothetical protein [Acaryochloris sp. 'Moss Beach']UJB69187.1 hypothetical protein HRE53_22815 [Acaryochloris sp. 'Moss Beach']